MEVERVNQKKRYKLKVAYDGTEYAGFQIQPNAPTIQGEIEQALHTMTKGKAIRIHGAGRTDAGVHAKGQVVHFDFPGAIPAENMKKALNALTSDAIAILETEIVDDRFHSRYLAKGKMYQYHVDNRMVADPLKRLYAYHHPYTMNVEKINRALKGIEGTHDFTSFSSIHSEVENKVRTIVEASVEVDEKQEDWIFTFRGDGFLYNMIRIFMGTLLEVGDGRREPEEMGMILRARDRELAGPTLNAKGLCMVEVYYDEQELNNPRNKL